MPQLVLCEKCQTVLYEGLGIKPPYQIIQEYDGKCPKCGKRLLSIPKKFEVKLVDSMWVRQSCYQLSNI